MGKEIIKSSAEKESAEGRNFGTDLNLQNISSRVLSKEILPQAHSNFTDLLADECISCKLTVEDAENLKIGDGRVCAECFQELTETVAKVLENGGNRQREAIRLVHCFGCDGNFATGKMSSLMMVCRECLKSVRDSGNEREQKRLVEKTMNRIGAFMRRQI